MSNTGKLVTHIDAFLAALAEIGARSPRYQELRAARVPEIDVNHLDAQTLGHWAAQMRGSFDDAFGDTFARLAGHQDAILAVSNDEALTSPVRRAAQAASRVKAAVDDLVEDVEYARTPQDMAMLVFKMIGAAFATAPNGPGLRSAVSQIEAYRRGMRSTGTA